MKRYLIFGAVVLSAIIGLVKAADTVDPATITGTNNRADSLTYFSETIFFKGASLQWTNCSLQTTGTVVQGLSGVTIQMKWGSAGTNVTFNQVVTSTNLGKWSLLMSVPTNWDNPSIQIKITDANTNTFIYPWRLIHVKDAM